LAANSQLLHLEFVCNEDSTLVELPLHYEALVPIVAAMYYMDSGTMDAMFTMFDNVELPLLFEVGSLFYFLVFKQECLGI
jgi:hypothetical protein